MCVCMTRRLKPLVKVHARRSTEVARMTAGLGRDRQLAVGVGVSVKKGGPVPGLLRVDVRVTEAQSINDCFKRATLRWSGKFDPASGECMEHVPFRPTPLYGHSPFPARTSGRSDVFD